MALVIFDKKQGPLIPVVCPNCKSQNPVIRGGKDAFTVLFPACGAWEKIEKGKVVSEVACRVISG